MVQHEGDPWEIASMGELLALAGAMEQEAIDGYIALGRRMNDMARPDLAAVFDSLVAEERTHLGKVDDWRIALGQSAARVPVHAPEESFDDEGAGIVAPALLSAYRAFSMAVRNEERAFVFWTYVSAHANSDEISQAAERMAREELGHVSKLRHERRKAFHQERSKALVVSGDDLPLLEKRLSRHLRTIAVQSGANDGARLQVLAHEADLRAEALAAQAFGTTPNPGRPPQAGLENALPICEFLVDCYLDLGDRSISEQDADRARSFAAQIIHCLRLLRGIASRAQLEGSRLK